MARSRGLSLVLVLLGGAAEGCGTARSVEAPSAAYAAPQGIMKSSAPPAPPERSSSKKDEIASEEPAATGASAPAVPPPPATTTPVAVAKGDPAAEVARDPTLMVYAAQLSLAVYKVEESLGAVEKIARDHGGFVAKRQDREIVVRVPRARFQAVVSGIDKIGDVLHRSVEAVDVTEEHVDLEIRIKNARAMQTRLKELLAKANVKEALEIEKEMHRVTGELELLEGKLKVLRDKIAYSTVAVSFEERAPSGVARTPRLPFAWLTDLGLPSLLSLTEEKK